MNKSTQQVIPMLYLTLVTYFFTTTVSAQTESNEWQIKLGAAVLSSDQPWKGAKQQTAIAPYITATKGNWSFGIDNLVTYHHNFFSNLSIDIGLGLRTNAFNSKASIFSKTSDNMVFQGYNTPELEIANINKIHWGWMSVSYTNDISNNSN